MNDRECVRFLQWCLPSLRMRWQGFRKVRKQACKRIEQRMQELGVTDVEAYRLLLGEHPEEWQVLDSLCTITISRFYRDKVLFQSLEQHVLPLIARDALDRGDRGVRCWSAGCASGEEPYTLALLWHFALAPRFPILWIRILATDLDQNLIDRARRGCYGASSLRELPPEWKAAAFLRQGNDFCVKPELGTGISFIQHDIREIMPEEQFHLLLCRNIAFTYFDTPLQQEILARLIDVLVPGGALVIGIHENLPECEQLTPWPLAPNVFRKK